MIPVYTLIKNSIQDCKTDMSDADKQALVLAINSIEAEMSAELIYAIIRSLLKMTIKSDSTIPYNGKIQKSGIRFELESLDVTLRKILQEFVRKHKEMISKDKEQEQDYVNI